MQNILNNVVKKRWFKNNITERQNVAEKWEKFISKHAEKKPPFRFGSHFLAAKPQISLIF